MKEKREAYKRIRNHAKDSFNGCSDGEENYIDEFNADLKLLDKYFDVDDDEYFTGDQTFPDNQQIYYTINHDGDIVKKTCEFDKEDLYNIAHSNYYASWQNAVRSRNQHLGIMQEVTKKIKESNKKERESKA